MTTHDRKTAPAFREIEKVEILQGKKHSLGNGIPVYIINSGTEEVTKIEFIFKAGTYALFHERQSAGSALLPSAVNHLLTEGTSTRTSAEIAEIIDFYGAFLQTESDKDTASVSLVTLNKYLTDTLPVFEEIIKDASFPENELQTYLQNTRQKFIVDTEKVHVLSRRKFNEVIFGTDHPYGKSIDLQDFDHLRQNDLINFFRRFYLVSNCLIIVSGKTNEDVLALLEKHFGSWDKQAETQTTAIAAPASLPQHKHFIERENQMQSAIRIGRMLFSKKHPDYPAMKVLNVLLGGYFGSRLMANIREDKGYTYGIGSAVFPLIQAGSFFISTEVGTEVTPAALKEIYYELSLLREQEVGADELQKVRNYMLGEFIRSVDGPFALAERLKGLILYGLDYSYYDNFIQTIKSCSTAQLRDLSQNYLQENDLHEVVVGSRKKVNS